MCDNYFEFNIQMVDTKKTYLFIVCLNHILTSTSIYVEDNHTLGRVSKYDSGTSISAKAPLLIAMAAFRIWLAHSLV